MSDLNGTEANQSGLSANTTTEHPTTTHEPVTTKDMAADIEQSNGHSLQDKTEAEALPSDNKENGSSNLDVGEKSIEPTVEDKMDTTEDPKDGEPAKQPTAEASTGDKRVRDEDDVEHKPTDTTTQQSSSEAAVVSDTNTTTDAAAATATNDTSASEPITQEAKKQKTDADATTIDTAEETAPSADTTAPATATEIGATEESTPKKKAGRPKKDDTKVPSVTDEVKEAVETVSRRTRSRGSA